MSGGDSRTNVPARLDAESWRTRTRDWVWWNCSIRSSKYPITSGFDW